MKLSSILRKAAQMVADDGWTKGEYGKPGDSVCITAAIYHAVGSRPNRASKAAASAEKIIEQCIGDPKGNAMLSTIAMNDKYIVDGDHAVIVLLMAAAIVHPH